jgi:amino acid permease
MLFSIADDPGSGGAIGAGLFIGSGSSFQSGGPASVLLGFIIIGTCIATSAVDAEF